MSIQIKVLLYNIKKSLFWKIIFLVLLIVNIIFYEVRPIGIETTNIDFIGLITYPTNIKLQFIPLLINLYQVIFALYFTYIYYTYEFEHSFENIIIRVNEKRWFLQKIMTLLLWLIISKIFYIGLLYIYFSDSVLFKIEYLFVPVLYYIFISLLLITLINFFKLNLEIKFAVLLIVCYLMFVNFNIYFTILYILALLLINFVCFHFKRYSNDKNIFN